MKRWAVIALLSCLTPGLVGARQAPVAADDAFAGRPLADALQDLRSRGLQLVFTTSTVGPHMIVAAEPIADDPRALLDELLEPHGLEAREGPNDTLVVVRRGTGGASLEAFIEGTVRNRSGSGPVGKAEVRLLDTDRRATSGRDGSFRLATPGAGVFSLEIRRRGFVVARLEGVETHVAIPAVVSLVLDPAPVLEEDLVVTPSRVSLLHEEPAAPIALSRRDILALPHLGDDFFRALSLLPGVTSNDVSAEFHVRGGLRNETQILLDGQELYETYHLKDFDNAVSVVAPSTLDSVELSTGGFSAEHGDRMSGVLDMTTVRPTGPRRTQIGLSVLNAQAGSAGTFAQSRGSWLAQVRRGSLDLADKLVSQPENPRYWDAFAKLDYQLGAANNLRANVLHSDDELETTEVTDETSKTLENDYASSYVWLTHQSVLGARLFFETAVSISKIERSRLGIEIDEDVEFEVRDDRELEVFGLRQDWNLQLASGHFLKWGVASRRFDTVYDYESAWTFDNPLAIVRFDPESEGTVFQRLFEEDHDSFYVADRLQLGEPALLELGLRYDEHTQTRETLWSPRLNLAWSLGERSVLRGAWGRYHQSQRPYELPVEDGERRFSRVERSVHQVVGFEHLFAREDGAPDVALRVELYQREVDNPVPRYENLYERINTFPELEPDRVRVAPDRSLAEGFEIFMRSRIGSRVGWWVNYAWATTEDEISGRLVPRHFDQTHTLNLDLDVRLGQEWSLNLAWRYHTGWPTTPLTLEETVDDEGEVEFVPVLGDAYSNRLPSYHRLDLRARRQWQLRAGTLELFIDVQNAYDRANIAGFDYEIDEEEGTIEPNPEEWAGILPSVGVSFEF
jgi:outer membrane receptor for ferrienterochelin and colicin